MALQSIALELRDTVAGLAVGPPVAFVYNPLDYAWRPHASYLERYGSGPIEVLLVGMNPGPWGMAQTGVPFGEVASVRDWLGLETAVDRPPREHPRRPVTGFDCRRSEVSGRRLWGWARDRFQTPERFFARFFVANYCPLMFLDEAGRNVTPDRLPADRRRPLEAACDDALRRTAAALQATLVVGVGRYAAGRCRSALAGSGTPTGEILHPSPANPAANRGWAEQATRQLAAVGIVVP